MPENIIQIDQNLLETRLDRLITEKNQDAENDNRVNARHAAPAHARIANGGGCSYVFVNSLGS